MSGLKLIVAGSRDLTWDVHGAIVRDAIRRWSERNGRPTLILSGCAKGADMIGEHLAAMARVPVDKHPAQWQFGPSAGPDRNQRMIDVADGLVVVRFPESRGSADVLRRAIAKWGEGSERIEDVEVMR